MKRYLVVLTMVVAALALLVASGGAAARPTPQLSKVCSAYAKNHFHDVTAHLPDGTNASAPASGVHTEAASPVPTVNMATSANRTAGWRKPDLQ
jgi:hypothetical protein